jgi:hypothetical protein
MLGGVLSLNLVCLQFEGITPKFNSEKQDDKLRKLSFIEGT